MLWLYWDDLIFPFSFRNAPMPVKQPWMIWANKTHQERTDCPLHKHFADGIFKCIFFNESFRILTSFSLKLVSKGPIHYKLMLLQVMAWHRTGDKPVPDQWCPSSLTHLCVTRSRKAICAPASEQWVNTPEIKSQHKHVYISWGVVYHYKTDSQYITMTS